MLAAGCASAREGAGSDPYVPPEGVALSALSASLRAWQDGRPGGPLIGHSPAVEVSDSYRTPDRPLRRFEVIGPFVADGARGFAVRLTLDNPPEEQVVRYLVVGKAPIWVFRHEDYERITHWEHKMEDDERAGPGPAAPDLSRN